MYVFIYYDIKNAKTYFNMAFLFLTVTILGTSIIHGIIIRCYLRTNVSSKISKYDSPKISIPRNFQLPEYRLWH